jgi:ElaB/YqjD/DUF883 family membrane-anchored ribosome-binding protein
MNPPPDPSADPQRIRSQIDETRHRMDETIDALGRRFQGRHLVDEALHFVRKQTENGNMTHFKEQIKHSADTAVHTVVDTVKANPIPAALIGAGIAWYVYSQTHDESRTHRYRDEEDAHQFYSHSDEPYGGASGGFDVGHTGEGVGGRIREKAGEIKERSREAIHHARDRAGELGSKVRRRSREMMQQSKECVSGAVDRHPLESGLVTLALGLIAGLALPAPDRVRSAVAPRARELRERGQDMMERGRHVARTAMDAAKQDAEAQGLTPGTFAGKTATTQPGTQAVAQPAGAPPV